MESVVRRLKYVRAAVRRIEKMNSDPADERTKIYLYNGLGCSDESSDMLKTALQKHVDQCHHEIADISPEDIQKGTWTRDAQVIVFGGGFDLGFIKALGTKGIQNIHDYVWEHGGSYLGLCAGGYFACDSIEFDQHGPLEVCGERHLKLYPGKCIGPAYPGFVYNSRRGAVAAPVSFTSYKPWLDQLESGDSVSLYTDGGGYFTELSDSGMTTAASGDGHQANGATNGRHDENFKIDVIGRFNNLSNSPPAIVRCHIGKNGGKAILSGVHFEYSPDKLIPGEKDLQESVVSMMWKSEKNRKKILTLVLCELGIHTYE